MSKIGIIMGSKSDLPIMQEAIEILKEYFPKKRIIDLDLKKNDTKPYEGILHLDCTFNPIGEDKCVIYKNGFVDEDDYQLVIDILGEENCFNVNDEEMFMDACRVIVEKSFANLIQYTCIFLRHVVLPTTFCVHVLFCFVF